MNYKPKDLLTLRRLSKESLTYPSFALSDFHRPCLFQQRSFTPEFAAAVAPPDLSECKPMLELPITDLNLLTIHSRVLV